MNSSSPQPTRVLHVGCGRIAETWMAALRGIPDAKLVGLFDIHAEAARALAQRHGLAPSLIYPSLGQALRAARPDVVFDTTIPSAHHRVTLAALRAGCHVLGEKPMSDTLPRARRMVAAADKAGRFYAVSQTRRANAQLRAAASFLRSGGIGDVQEVHADFFLGPHFGGFRDLMDDPLIVDMAIHTFDAARALAAADPVSVYCYSFNPRRSWYKGDASAIAVFEMTGGVVFTYRGSWCAEGLPTSWESQWRVIGQRGTLLWDGQESVRAQAVKVEGKPGHFADLQDVPVPVTPLPFASHEALIRDFLDCVRTGRRPETDCHDNIKSLAMVFAAVRSARTGRRIAIHPVNARHP